MKYIKFAEQSMLMFVSMYGHFGRFISIIKDCVYLWKFIFLRIQAEKFVDKIVYRVR